MKKNHNEDEAKRNMTWLLFAMLVIVLMLWIMYWFLIINSDKLTGWSERGTFGDMFGALNTLFAGFAFAGLIYAITIQTQQLSLQRSDLILTRAELERTANAQEESGRILDKQTKLLAISVYMASLTAELQLYPKDSFGVQTTLEKIRQLQADTHIILFDSKDT